jgi:NAD(P)-dependent dehydrogenase (short-subunit alcohol dehydrogenase family)
MKLQNKVTIVTGSTSGIGEAIARRFLEEGALVVLSGRSEERGKALELELNRKDERVIFVGGDITRAETNRALVEAAKRSFGGLDILVPCAGSLCLGAITEISAETWERGLGTNLTSVYHLLHYGIPELQARGQGCVVAVGSIAAYRGFPGHAVYCAAKGGLIPLIRQVAADYAPTVRANIICPGPIDTPMLHDSAAAFPDPEKAISDVAERTPMKRLGIPTDVASAALFLASDDSAWINGSALDVDGGVMIN